MTMDNHVEGLTTEQDQSFLRLFDYRGLEEGTLEYEEALALEGMIEGGIDTLDIFCAYVDHIQGLLDSGKYHIGRLSKLSKYTLQSSFRDLRTVIEAYFSDTPEQYLQSRAIGIHQTVHPNYRGARYFVVIKPDDDPLTCRFDTEVHTALKSEVDDKVFPPRLRFQLTKMQRVNDQFINDNIVEIRMDRNLEGLLEYDLKYTDCKYSPPNKVGTLFANICTILISHYSGERKDIDPDDFITGIFLHQVKSAEVLTGVNFRENPILILGNVKDNIRYHFSTGKKYPLQTNTAYNTLATHIDRVDKTIVQEQLMPIRGRGKLKRRSNKRV